MRSDGASINGRLRDSSLEIESSVNHQNSCFGLLREFETIKNGRCSQGNLAEFYIELFRRGVSVPAPHVLKIQGLRILFSAFLSTARVTVATLQMELPAEENMHPSE